MPVQSVAEEAVALRRAREENETLYAVIKTVSSSLDLDRVLRGIVDITTDATESHACFIYFLEDDRLTLRAATSRYSGLVGELVLGAEPVRKHQLRERALGRDERKHAQNVLSQLFLRRLGVGSDVDARDPRAESRHRLVEDRFEDVVLPGEVKIEGAARDVGLRDDVVDRRFVIADLGKHRARGLQDLVATMSAS